MNAGAMQCYRDSGVTHKHLLVAPEDACEICMAAKEEEIIPLDAIFPDGGLGGPFHPNCRCIPAPAGFNAEPPQAHLGKSLDHPYARDIHSGAGNCECGNSQDMHPAASMQEDDSRIAWLLIRARDEDGKWRYLLQQRPDGTWGMPGGTTHVGESGYTAAYRETIEEIGDLPQLTVVRDFSHAEDDGKYAFLYLAETYVPFKSMNNGSTPQETLSTGWFRRKEISDLNLADKFRDDWENHPDLESALKESASKHLQSMVTETGEQIVLDDPDRHGAGMGSRWPYPQRGGAEWPDAGPGAVPGPSAGGEPPRSDPDHADSAGARLYPRGSQDDKYPKRRGRNRPASRFPDSDPGEGGMYPSGDNDDPGPDAVSVGSPKNDRGHPVVGAPVPQTPKPATPQPKLPEPFDPADAVEEWSPEADSDIVHSKGAQHVTDPNPVEWRHVYAQLQKNFPDSKLDWVKRARWIGPVNIPWSRIDDDDIDSWAASHEPGRVSHFVRAIRSGNGDTSPSILVQEPSNGKAFIVDGHHRALARRRLGMPVLAYVGNIDARDREAAEELHSSQIHQGNDPGNQ
jgi:8-oxo-dGTP pyrophosphatase MutT (NUDIX family)